MDLFAILRLFLGLLIITISGLPLTLILLPPELKQNLLFTETVSYAIGVGDISLVMILMSLLEVNFSFKTILYFLMIVVFLGFLIVIYQIRYLKLPKNIVKKNKKFINKKSNIKILDYKNYFKVFNKRTLIKIIEIILIILILFQVLTSIFITIIFPVRFWDAITCWSFKAKAFFLDKNIYDFYNEHSYKFSHPSYPILLPLLQTFSYFSIGTLNKNLMKILFPFFYISLLIANYSFLRIRYSEINSKVDKNSGKIKKVDKISRNDYIKTASLFFTFILSTVPIIFDHAYIEYTNLAFAFYLFFINYVYGALDEI